MRFLKINYLFTYSDDYRLSILKNNPIFSSIIYKNMKKLIISSNMSGKRDLSIEMYRFKIIFTNFRIMTIIEISDELVKPKVQRQSKIC